MKCQEFAYETVVDRGIIRSPAKRNRSPGGPGKCFCALPDFFSPFFALNRNYKWRVLHKNHQESGKT